MRRLTRWSQAGDVLRRTFANALDDRDVADLTRIMGRISGSISS